VEGGAGCRRAFEVDITAFVRDARGGEWAAFRDHYPLCADCRAEVRTWTELERMLRGAPPASAHPTPRDLLDADDESPALDPGYRRIVEYHLTTCAACADELAALRAFDFDEVGGASPVASGIEAAVADASANGHRALAVDAVDEAPEPRPETAPRQADEPAAALAPATGASDAAAPSEASADEPAEAAGPDETATLAGEAEPAASEPALPIVWVAEEGASAGEVSRSEEASVEPPQPADESPLRPGERPPDDAPVASSPGAASADEASWEVTWDEASQDEAWRLEGTAEETPPPSVAADAAPAASAPPAAWMADAPEGSATDDETVVRPDHESPWRAEAGTEASPPVAMRIGRLILHPAFAVSAVLAMLLPVLWRGDLPDFPFGRSARVETYREVRVSTGTVPPRAAPVPAPAPVKAASERPPAPAVEDSIGRVAVATVGDPFGGAEESAGPSEEVITTDRPAPSTATDAADASAATEPTVAGAPSIVEPAAGSAAVAVEEPALGEDPAADVGSLAPDELVALAEPIALAEEDLPPDPDPAGETRPWAIARLDAAAAVDVVVEEVDAGLVLEVPVPKTVPSGAVLQVTIRGDDEHEIVERLPLPRDRVIAVRVAAPWLVPGAYRVDLGLVKGGPAPRPLADYRLTVR